MFYFCDFRCPVDKNIVGPLVYSPDMSTAWVETHAFKFADDVNLYFKCEISLCQKAAEEGCMGVSVSIIFTKFNFFLFAEKKFLKLSESVIR